MLGSAIERAVRKAELSHPNDTGRKRRHAGEQLHSIPRSASIFGECVEMPTTTACRPRGTQSGQRVENRPVQCRPAVPR